MLAHDFVAYLCALVAYAAKAEPAPPEPPSDLVTDLSVADADDIARGLARAGWCPRKLRRGQYEAEVAGLAVGRLVLFLRRSGRLVILTRGEDAPGLPPDLRGAAVAWVLDLH